jgi:hypothetical protein
MVEKVAIEASGAQVPRKKVISEYSILGSVVDESVIDLFTGLVGTMLDCLSNAVNDRVKRGEPRQPHQAG